MTHRKKLTIFLLAVATLFTFVFLIHPYRKNDSSLLSDKLLRFRVLADSDSSIDQYEKNELSKKMITLLSPALSDIKTKEEALTLLRESLPFLNAYCNYVLSDYGAQNYASCTLGSHLFPYKTYGNYQFPAGIYDTLLVTIGSGRGSNWWCLAFPPLPMKLLLTCQILLVRHFLICLVLTCLMKSAKKKSQSLRSDFSSSYYKFFKIFSS